MNPAPRQIHVHGKSDLLWLLPIMFMTWAIAALAGFDMGVSFLAGVSASMIALTASTFRAGKSEKAYWPTIALYSVAHVILLAIVGGRWIPAPAVALSPLFIVDYLAMSFGFPRITGIAFDLS